MCLIRVSLLFYTYEEIITLNKYVNEINPFHPDISLNS